MVEADSLAMALAEGGDAGVGGMAQLLGPGEPRLASGLEDGAEGGVLLQTLSLPLPVAIEAVGARSFAEANGIPLEECFNTLLTGLAVRYYKAVAG